MLLGRRPRRALGAEGVLAPYLYASQVPGAPEQVGGAEAGHLSIRPPCAKEGAAPASTIWQALCPS